jgi:hypothetical protein
MDPVSAILLFVLFQTTEKAVKYAGGKIADSMPMHARHKERVEDALLNRQTALIK